MKAEEFDLFGIEFKMGKNLLSIVHSNSQTQLYW